MKRSGFLTLLFFLVVFLPSVVLATNCCVYYDGSTLDCVLSDGNSHPCNWSGGSLRCVINSAGLVGDCPGGAQAEEIENSVAMFETDINSCTALSGYGAQLMVGAGGTSLCAEGEENTSPDLRSSLIEAKVKELNDERGKNTCCIPLSTNSPCHAGKVVAPVSGFGGYVDIKILNDAQSMCALSDSDSVMYGAINVPCSSGQEVVDSSVPFHLKTVPKLGPWTVEQICKGSGQVFCACKTDRSECNSDFYVTKNRCESVLQPEWECIENPPDICSKLVVDKQKVEETPIKTMSIGTLKGMAAESFNPASLTSATQIIGRAIKLLTAFVGSIALALYVYSGLLWMTSAGNSGQVDKAKNILIWATLGVVIMLGSYVLVDFLFKSIG